MLQQRRVLLSPAASDILEGACFRGDTAARAAQAIFDQTGERVSERTTARRMAAWRARRTRVDTFQNLGIAIAALRGDEQELQTLGSPFAAGKHPPCADELVRSVQTFIRRPEPSALAEVLLNCLLYQIGTAVAKRPERA